MDTDFRSYRKHICAVYQPLVIIRHDLHLIMDALEDHMCDNTINTSLSRFQKINIFRTDDYINRFILTESCIHAREINAKYLDQTILHHSRGDDITFSDEICNKSVFRFVIDFFRGTDLLDVSLVHDHNRIRHSKRLFLIMCNVQKCDSKLIFKPDQLILHILPKFQIKCSKRLIKKQHFRLIYNSSCNRNTLLLASAQRIRHTIFESVQIDKLQRIFNLVINILLAFIFYL